MREPHADVTIPRLMDRGLLGGGGSGRDQESFRAFGAAKGWLDVPFLCGGFEGVPMGDDPDADGGSVSRQEGDEARLLSTGGSELPLGESMTRPWSGPMSPVAGRFSAGDVIDGRFEVRGRIGMGGMGSVLRVESQADQQCYALKYCHLEGENRQRFTREVRLMELVEHPNVVPVLFSNLEHDPPYFIMPLAERSLASHVTELRQDEATSLAIFQQVCRGVRAIHDSGIVHRDIKPANVLCFEEGRVAVADLGLAKRESTDRTVLTQTRAVVGTLDYLAPEQFLPSGSREADVRTDVCQLGKMLYQLLTGRSPFLIEPEALPRGLAHVVQRATSLNPDDRYQTLSEFLDALRYYQLSKDPTKNPREVLENLIVQAEELLASREYRSENLKDILGLLGHLPSLEHGAAVEFLDRVPEALLPVMAREYPGEFVMVLKSYSVAIEAQVAGYDFAYADEVARRMGGVFRQSLDPEVKTIALQVLLIAAVKLNRFAAIGVFNRLLATVKTVDLAIPIAEMLRRRFTDYRSVAAKVPPDRLHPAIRDVQSEALDVG